MSVRSRCVMCGRRVSASGVVAPAASGVVAPAAEARVVPGLGRFGSECVRKVAGFETLLEQHHAEDLAAGIFVPHDASKERKSELGSLAAKLRSAGIKVLCTSRDGGLELRLGGVGVPARARPFLRSLGDDLKVAA